MNPFAVLLLGVAALTAYTYTRGRRENLSLQSRIAGILGKALTTVETDFTNIGGVVGFHFEASRKEVPRSITGTLTLFPRHALLYYPIARLRGREDELALLAPLPPTAMGEGHLLNRRYWEAGRIDITDSESMEQEKVVIAGQEAVVLFYNPLVRDHLAEFARSCPDPSCLRHVSFTPVNRSGYLLIHPNPDTLETVLVSWTVFLDRLQASGSRF